MRSPLAALAHGAAGWPGGPAAPNRSVRPPAILGALLCILALWMAPVRSAAAQGIIVTAGVTGISGPQTDAVALSPALRRPVSVAMRPRPYVVQPGDTLSKIAANFGMDVRTLAARNALTNLDRIEAGRTLAVDVAAPSFPNLRAGGPLTRLQLWPWPPIQGQTLVLWFHATEPMTSSLSLGNRSVPVTVEGRRAWAMIPIPVLAPLESNTLTLTVGSHTVRIPLTVQPGVFAVEVIPAAASDPILSQADKVNGELRRMTALFSARSEGKPAAWTPSSRFRVPLEDEYEHTSPFGSRRTYGGSSDLLAHLGEDYAAPPGTPVVVPAAGFIVLAEPLFVRGNAVVIDHGRGVFTGYWHLDSLSVKAGGHVSAGQVLGRVGNTGLSTGAHLHWEMRVDGVAVDPLQWVEK